VNARIPEQTIEEIARRTDIVQLVGQYVNLKAQGSRYVGLCPFHTEKTPSFSVNPERGAYYCFGCQKKGTVFTFIMELEGLTFPEAVRHLGERAGVAVEAEEQDDESRRRKALAELYERVAGSFAYLLRDSELGREGRQILHERGVSDDSMAGFGLGFAPPDPRWLHPFLRGKGYSDEFLASCGLFTRADPRRALFVRRIMFPIHDRYGKVVAFGGRLVSGDGPKYINSPETPLFQKRSLLYAHHLARDQIRRQRRAVIAEGYMDVIALHQAGVTNAVAPLGTAFTEAQARQLARSADRVTLLFDADRAGIEATGRAAQILEQAEVVVEVVGLNSGEDPADILRERGGQALADAVSSPTPALEYILSSSHIEAADIAHGQSDAVRAVFPYIHSIISAVRKDEALSRIADYFGLRREAVREDFRRFEHDGPAPVSPERVSETSRVHRGHLSAELFLLMATVANREHFSYVRRSVQPADLEDLGARELYVALEECYRRGEESLDVLISRIHDAALAALVRDRILTGEFDENTDQVVRDSVAYVRRRTLTRRRQELNAQLARLKTLDTSDVEQMRSLIEEQSHIDRELQKLKGEA
jgi:DNA primase